jgi:8-amino-7-oxononanoate synthase
VPVVLGDNEDALNAATYLQRAGFAVRAIRPPTVPAGRARLRFSITIQVSEEQLKRLAGSLTAWRERGRQVIPITAKRA